MNLTVFRWYDANGELQATVIYNTPNHSEEIKTALANTLLLPGSSLVYSSNGGSAIVGSQSVPVETGLNIVGTLDAASDERFSILRGLLQPRSGGRRSLNPSLQPWNITGVISPITHLRVTLDELPLWDGAKLGNISVDIARLNATTPPTVSFGGVVSIDAPGSGAQPPLKFNVSGVQTQTTLALGSAATALPDWVIWKGIEARSYLLWLNLVRNLNATEVSGNITGKWRTVVCCWT